MININKHIQKLDEQQNKDVSPIAENLLYIINNPDIYGKSARITFITLLLNEAWSAGLVCGGQRMMDKGEKNEDSTNKNNH
jgi:hypothetical protein